MAFRFSLESILRYHESLEKVEEIALHKIVQEIASVELDIQQLETTQQSLREQRERDLSRGVPAVHLQELSEQEMQFLLAAETLRTRLQTLEAKRIAQLALYHKAQQDRQILSEVREQKHESYRREQHRKEQKTLDDLFLARLQNDK